MDKSYVVHTKLKWFVSHM